MILASVQKSENSFSPSKNCLLNDKSLTGHDIRSYVKGEQGEQQCLAKIQVVGQINSLQRLSSDRASPSSKFL
ncbi:hypothetical protein [Nostoc sp. LPT]|uniref:hypothetical protein n=1 Tax=Nostoc sp. LPT TaxID=2815387 RepID=UPI001DF16BBA|nr:hypothetical protein [Nostoc sp. LPT]MBN4004085.1 hypothetical protein [Nostoc sp. LPT]